ncbi:MAG TPA: transketolase family protein [bacterium (Candidatus Stahlbacteria)]|nr:transketolase family protein [Candidatus Stahlbacteria bacterium]
MSETISVRDTYGETLVELGRNNPNIVVLDADLAKSTRTILFKEVFPERFFDIGIAEADMMGTAAGLASCGKIVFVSTFAIFASGRAWEQVRTSVTYPRLNVKIVATHGGISVGPDGYTHQANEDISLMRAIPAMRVIVPCDAKSTAAAVRIAAKEEGPFYIRLTRHKLTTIYDGECPFELGKAIRLRNGSDVTIIAIGSMVIRAIKAATILENEGISARVVDMHTVKPVDEEEIKHACYETKGIITCEDHTVIGGLGDAVSEVVLREKPIPLRRVGIQDRFGESGDIDELYQKYGLTPENIVRETRKLLE